MSSEGGATRLEHLTPGAVVSGVTAGGPVTVVQVQWHGSSAITLTYRDAAGNVAQQLLYRETEPLLRVEQAARHWSFDADGHLFRLASEARRIQLAYLFDPMLAVHLSALEPLPHQIRAVYGDMLPREQLRFLLADDPGAGKTIMAGLYIKELLLRGDLARCLVVAPGGLVTQWQDELADKFGLRFDIVDRDMIESSQSQNPFAERNLLVARLDHLSRNELLQERLQATDWDLVVVDEAHRMAAHRFGGEVKETKRYRLGKLLGSICRHFLLMTATPHAGKEDDFQLFLALLDADRFEGRARDGAHTVDTSDLMRRMIKEKLLRFDGRKLFPERIASTVPYPLSDDEARLYDAVTTYVTEEMNQVDRLKNTGEGRRGNRVGFALTVLQRRLASSPEAIYQSVKRRRHRLESELAEWRLRARVQAAPRDIFDPLLDELDTDDDPDRFDDLAESELEEIEEELVDGASAARTAAELESEITTLVRLEELARRVRASESDRKWVEFSTLLEERPEMRHADGSPRKLIVFTEHRDTLNYLVQKLRNRLGRAEAVVTIHGGTGREERRAIQERFNFDDACLILVATDAAGEGLNLQRAHLVVNYDLPWNPNRIEQRFGRVHRIGQEEVCHMWNLVAEDTREGQVYLTLLQKLEQQREALGGEVFDVLGDAFRDRPLRDLLMDAIRYGDRPEKRDELNQVIDATIGDGLRELVDRHALAADVLGETDVEKIRLQMEEANARRLQPHHVRAWFLAAFTQLGGRIAEREPGRYQITNVPAEIRARDRLIGRAAPVLTRYERVCFDKDKIRQDGKPLAELMAPGHPLLDATLDLVLERYRTLLLQGAVLVDESDQTAEPRAIVYLEHSIADGRSDAHGNRRVVSRRYEFVELYPDGSTGVAGYAPYLDYRPAEPEEIKLLDDVLADPWLARDLETAALDTAIERAVPEHLREVTLRTKARVQKVRAAVHERLTKAINEWDHRANELDDQVAAGRQPKMNPDRARQRADDLSTRLKARMDELDREEQLQALPPVLVGGALVVPAGMLARLRGEAPPPDRARDVTAVERRAVDAVMASEIALGNEPEEMARNHPGYDIRSLTPDGHYRFIEVKGRLAGAETVTITRNEIITGLNTDQWILALVEVHPDGRDDVRYLHHPFRGEIDDLGFRETSRTFGWCDLFTAAGAPA